MQKVTSWRRPRGDVVVKRGIPRGHYGVYPIRPMIQRYADVDVS